MANNEISERIGVEIVMTYLPDLPLILIDEM
jgi:hypothetical protein